MVNYVRIWRRFMNRVMHFAVAVGPAWLIRLACTLGADPNNRTSLRSPPLCSVAAFGILDRLQALLDSGADPNAAFSENGGMNALFVAVSSSVLFPDPRHNLLVIEALINAGSNVSFNGTSVLTFARHSNLHEVADFLQSKGIQEERNSVVSNLSPL